MGIRAVALPPPNCPFPDCSLVRWKVVPRGKQLWGLLAGYTAELTTRLLAGKRCLCAPERKESKATAPGKLWFSSVSSRHAAGFPPGGLSPHWLGSETPKADATEQEGQGAFEALSGRTGIGRTRVSLSRG